MAKTFNVAAFVGSLRKHSLNRKIATALGNAAPSLLRLKIVEIGQLPLHNDQLSRWRCPLLILPGLALYFLPVGWDPAEGDLGHQMSAAGYVAMALGIVVTLALGIGLLALIFYGNRQGYDWNTDLMQAG